MMQTAGMIKSFNLQDLVGRTLEIRKLMDDNLILFVAIDISSGDLFALQTIDRPLTNVMEYPNKDVDIKPGQIKKVDKNFFKK